MSVERITCEFNTVSGANRSMQGQTPIIQRQRHRKNKYNVDFYDLESIKSALAIRVPSLRISEEFTQSDLHDALRATVKPRDAETSASGILCNHAKLPFVNADGETRLIAVTHVFSGKNKFSTAGEIEERRREAMVARPKGTVALCTREHEYIVKLSEFINVKLTTLKEIRKFDFHGPPDANAMCAYGQMCVSTGVAKSGPFYTGKSIDQILDYLRHGGLVFLGMCVGSDLCAAYVMKPSDLPDLELAISLGNIPLSTKFSPVPFGTSHSHRNGAITLTSVLKQYFREMDRNLRDELRAYFTPASAAPRRTVIYLNEDPSMIPLDFCKEVAYMRRLEQVIDFTQKDFGNGDIEIFIDNIKVVVEMKKATPTGSDASKCYHCNIRSLGGLPININNVDCIAIAVPNTRVSGVDMLMLPEFYNTFIFLSTRTATGASAFLNPVWTNFCFRYSTNKGFFSTSHIQGSPDALVIDNMSPDVDVRIRISNFMRTCHNRPKLTDALLSTWVTSIDTEKEHEKRRKRRRTNINNKREGEDIDPKA